MLEKTRKILIVVDDLNTDWLEYCSPEGKCEYLLLTLGIPAEAYQRENRAALIQYGVKFAPVEDVAAEARLNIEKTYPQLMFDLVRKPISGGKSILDLLVTRDLNMWWLSDSSEKSVFRSPLVNHLYFLELISLSAARLECDEIWFSVRCQSLRRCVTSFSPMDGRQVAVRHCSNAVPKRWLGEDMFVFALLLRRIALFVLVSLQYLVFKCGRFDRQLNGVDVLLFTSYPFMWRYPLTAECADKFYGMLPEVLNEWKRTAYIAILNVLWLGYLWKLGKLRANFNRLRIVPLVLFANISDLVSVISPGYLVTIIKAMANVTKMESHFYKEYDIAPLILNEIRHSLLKAELPLDILWLKCVRRLCEESKIKFIIHWGEFQPIERAIQYGARATGAKTVAFQHSTCSSMFLNYHFGHGEIAAHLNNKDVARAMPLPSLFVTTGLYAAKSIVRMGFPEARVAVCGAIRYRELIKARWSNKREDRLLLSSRARFGLTGEVILVATTSKLADNVHMMNALCAALAAHEGEVTVVLRFHPLVGRAQARTVEASMQACKQKVKCVRMETDIPLHDLVLLSDVVVTNSSTAGVEAMTLGVTPIFFHNPHLYDVSILYSLDHCVLFASGARELEEKLGELFNGEARLANQNGRCSEDVKGLFYELDTLAEERFVKFLRQQCMESS